MTISPSHVDDLRDVNERLLTISLRDQESAEAAQRETARLNALIEALHDGVVMSDSSGRVVTINSVARRLMDMPEGETVAFAAFDAVDWRDVGGSPLPAGEHPVRRAMRGDAFVESEVLVRVGGDTRRLLASGRTVRSAGGASSAIVVLRDVTDRRLLEERVAQSEKLAALGTLSAGMAHEINTPLAYALGNVDFVLGALPEIQGHARSLPGAEAAAIGARLEAVVEALSEAREGGVRVSDIVGSLRRLGLDGARDDGPLDLTRVIESARAMTANYVRHHATVRCAYGVTPLVRANASQLGQVFTNLLMNAAHASSAGAGGRSVEASEVVVTTYTDDAGRAVAEVRDSGTGISNELKGKIFDPFVTTKPIGQGTGLGLSICFSIVRSLGGELTVTSELGEGAIFRVALSPASPALVEVAEPSAPVVPGRARRGRVLVIDDDPAMTRVMRRFLEACHDVTTSGGGREALGRILGGEVFDVILCDVMMPGMGGQELHAEVQRHDAELATRFVFVTGGAFTPRAEAFLESVPNIKLMKPLDVNRLRQVVNDQIERVYGADV
jgi:two-component system cell cycle sensor histidine kinase/response regulator CckA